MRGNGVNMKEDHGKCSKNRWKSMEKSMKCVGGQLDVRFRFRTKGNCLGLARLSGRCVCLKTWMESLPRPRQVQKAWQEPYVVVVGAGLCGLALAAHLQRLQVPYLLIDRAERPGDSWRQWPTPPRCRDWQGLERLPFRSPPVLRSRGDVAQWLEGYAVAQGLTFKGGCGCRQATWQPEQRRWQCQVPGEELWCSQLVLATGRAPALPQLPWRHFKGQVLHTAFYEGGKAFEGKEVCLVGADCHVARDLWEYGASVTLVQEESEVGAAGSGEGGEIVGVSMGLLTFFEAFAGVSRCFGWFSSI